MEKGGYGRRVGERTREGWMRGRGGEAGEREGNASGMEEERGIFRSRDRAYIVVSLVIRLCTHIYCKYTVLYMIVLIL